MDDKEKKEILEKMREAIKARRGYADFFEWPDRQTKEVQICKITLETIGYIGKVEPSKSDPPDVTFRKEGLSADIGIELTELVCQATIENWVKWNKGKVNEYPDSAIWTIERVMKGVISCIETKDKKLERVSGFLENWLIVHSDEMDIMSLVGKVEDRAKHCAPYSTVNIDRVFLVLSYDPRRNGYPVIEWPVERNIN